PGSISRWLASECRSRTFFFFQAEDGIRDRNVTGVQTCALPIFHPPRCPPIVTAGTAVGRKSWTSLLGAAGKPVPEAEHSAHDDRSEERRVGKECRCRGWRCEEKRKVMRFE